MEIEVPGGQHTKYNSESKNQSGTLKILSEIFYSFSKNSSQIRAAR